MSFIVSVVLSVAIVTIAGIVINRLVLDRVVGAEPLIGLLSTAGLLLVIDSFALAFFGSASISVEDPVSASIEILGTFYPVYRLVVAGIAIAAIAGIFCFLRFTRQGLLRTTVLWCGSPQMLAVFCQIVDEWRFREGNSSRPGQFVIERAFVDK
jgi:branched-subunit amino acid ABC-type transport system permease component